MTAAAQFLNPSEAARRLGVSIKALRLYKQHGLIAPRRSGAGWRMYGQDETTRITEIVALRDLGLSLSQVRQVLSGDAATLESALSGHQAMLEGRLRQLVDVVDRVRQLRAGLASGNTPATADIAHLIKLSANIGVAFDLPWPWGGERFALRDIRPLNHIVGALGSGKTRLALRLAEVLPNAIFLGLERMTDGGAEVQTLLDADPSLRSRVRQTCDWLVGDGAKVPEALLVLLVALETQASNILVVDMLEHGLDHASQQALIAWLRRRAPDAKPMFFLTRSSAILDLGAIGCHETIIFCPANHAPPSLVAPYPGAPGYEAVLSCLASPDVRARTEGIIA